MSTYDLIDYFSKIKPSKSSSFDGLSNIMLKKSAPVIVNSLTYIYNLCIDLHYFPVMFKEAMITPILKKGDIDDPSHF